MADTWQEITTLAQLDALDQDAIVQGYMDGLHSVSNHTRTDQAYWHGHGNARSDRTHSTTPGQQQLAREIVASRRFSGA